MGTVNWIDKLLRDTARFGLVFVHLGTAFATQREELLKIEASQMEAEKFCQGDFGPESLDRIVILTDLERMRRNRRASLGQLREKVMAAADEQRSIVLVSRVSKDSYESSMGSDLIHDARQHYASLTEVTEDPSSPIADTPKTPLVTSDLMRSCLMEVGYRTLESVSQILWEHGKSPNDALAEFDNIIVNSLRGAGLVEVKNGVAEWTILPLWKQFRHAVAEVSSARIEPTAQLGATFIDLWVVERIIRNRVREELKMKMGSGWRDSCIPTKLKPEILSRARLDAHPRADGLKDLRDPLEWLSLAELLDLREIQELGDLGLESYLWTKFRSVIAPLRNRISHMRLINDGDAREISSWRAIIERKLAPPA